MGDARPRHALFFGAFQTRAKLLTALVRVSRRGKARQMTQNEIDLAWSRFVAEDAADELLAGKVIMKTDLKRAEAIIAQMIHIHLVSDDRPDATNRRYRNSQ